MFESPTMNMGIYRDGFVGADTDPQSIVHTTWYHAWRGWGGHSPALLPSEAAVGFMHDIMLYGQYFSDPYQHQRIHRGKCPYSFFGGFNQGKCSHLRTSAKYCPSMILCMKGLGICWQFKRQIPSPFMHNIIDGQYFADVHNCEHLHLPGKNSLPATFHSDNHPMYRYPSVAKRVEYYMARESIEQCQLWN